MTEAAGMGQGLVTQKLKETSTGDLQFLWAVGVAVQIGKPR